MAAADFIKLYEFHGLKPEVSGKEALADCPWCGGEAKFSINIETGMWRCFGCNNGTESGKASRGGNIYTFLKMLFDVSVDNTTDRDRAVLGIERKLLYPEDTLYQWGVVKSKLNGRWLVPAYNTEGKLANIYKYTDIQNKNGEIKRVLMGTPTLGAQLFGIHLRPVNAEEIILCEGPWDAMTVWELLIRCKSNEEQTGFELTSNPDISLSSTVAVLAVPGCTTFHENWCELFHGKRAHIWYDSDHPKQDKGKSRPPAGYSATERVVKMLTGSPTPPLSVSCIKWGAEGYDPDLKDGYDVRDYINE